MSKLDKWAKIAEIASAIAVVLSLLYVGYELRRSSSISEVDSAQELATMSQELAIFMNEPAIADLMFRGDADYSSLNDVEKGQFTDLAKSHFNLWEHAYYSHAHGVLSDDLWRIWNASFCYELPISWYQAFHVFDQKNSFLPGFMVLQRECYQDLKSQHGSGDA